MILFNSKSKKNKIKKACFLYYSRFKFDAILYREAKALKDKEFVVDIICLGDNNKDKIIQKYNGLNLYYIQSRPSNEKKAISYFTNLTLFIIKSAIFLSYLSIKKRYDIIHVTSPPDVIVFASLIPKLLGTKIILDIHDIGPELYMRKLNVSEDKTIIKILKFLERLSTRFADHIITVTDLWHEKLINRSVKPNKCTVLLNVADDELFKPLENKLSNGFNLFYHGTLEEHFGVDTLLKAMPMVKKNIPNVSLAIYGGGRLREVFIELTKSLNINDCVQFHHGVPFYELPQILDKADLGIVPTKDSIFADEALSGKGLEYIALGIPIVISGTKVHRYYYDENMVKFFTPNDAHDLAKEIISLYKNNSERERLLRHSQEFIQKHGWQEHKKVYYQIVDNLICNGAKHYD